MPRIKYITPKNVPPPDMVKDLVIRYQNASGVSNRKIANEIGVSESTYACRKSRGWLVQVRELGAIARFLDIPPEELGKAIMYK